MHYIVAACATSIFPIFYIFFFRKLKLGEWASIFEGILGIHYAIMGFMIVVAVVISVTFWLIVRPDRAPLKARAPEGS
jgi:riboflavin transporter FmnP